MRGTKSGMVAASAGPKNCDTAAKSAVSRKMPISRMEGDQSRSNRKKQTSNSMRSRLVIQSMAGLLERSTTTPANAPTNTGGITNDRIARLVNKDRCVTRSVSTMTAKLTIDCAVREMACAAHRREKPRFLRT